MNNSIWTDIIKGQKPSFKALDGDLKTDVLIIGGGVAGILCAYFLKQEGVDCVLLEKGEICGGVTQDTTAKITFQHGLIYDKIIKRYGQEKAKLYLKAQKMAMDEYASLCKQIECDYEKKDLYVYSLKDKTKIEREVEALKHLGVNAEFTREMALPFGVAGALRVLEQAQFNPLKLLYQIAKDLPIYENTKVLELKPNVAIAKNGQVSCKKMIIATHFPFLNKHGAYFLKMYQHRSYVLSLENAPVPSAMYVDENDKGMSFRAYKNTLLIGGGGHKTGKNGGCWTELEAFVKEHYKNAKITNKWATQDCITLDKIPYIGHYSRGTNNLFVSTGFNKWGMTSSMVSSKLLCDLIMGKENELAPVFSPSRSIMHKELVVNMASSLVGLVTPTTPRCPHLGCALKYNKEEHSWDCPCHGSRFGENGEVLNYPATDDLQ